MPSGLFLVSTSLAFCLAGGLPLGPSALPGTWRLRGPGPGIKQGSLWDASLGQACESRGLTLALGRESDGSERQVGRKTFFRGPTNCESRSLPWALGPGEDTSERQGSRRSCEAERSFQALPGAGRDSSARQVAFPLDGDVSTRYGRSATAWLSLGGAGVSRGGSYGIVGIPERVSSVGRGVRRARVMRLLLGSTAVVERNRCSFGPVLFAGWLGEVGKERWFSCGWDFSCAEGLVGRSAWGGVAVEGALAGEGSKEGGGYVGATWGVRRSGAEECCCGGGAWLRSGRGIEQPEEVPARCLWGSGCLVGVSWFGVASGRLARLGGALAGGGSKEGGGLLGAGFSGVLGVACGGVGALACIALVWVCVVGPWGEGRL